MSKKGRPTKISAEIQAEIVKYIKIGCYVETAVSCVGLAKGTFYDWMQKGQRQKRGPFRNFYLAVDQAIAESEARDIARLDQLVIGVPAKYDEGGKKIREEVPGDWRGIAWRLERRHPKKWGRRDAFKIVGDDDDFGGAEEEISPEKIQEENKKLLEELGYVKR